MASGKSLQLRAITAPKRTPLGKGLVATFTGDLVREDVSGYAVNDDTGQIINLGRDRNLSKRARRRGSRGR